MEIYTSERLFCKSLRAEGSRRIQDSGLKIQRSFCNTEPSSVHLLLTSLRDLRLSFALKSRAWRSWSNTCYYGPKGDPTRFRGWSDSGLNVSSHSLRLRPQGSGFTFLAPWVFLLENGDPWIVARLLWNGVRDAA